jgi:hypothetical protein
MEAQERIEKLTAIKMKIERHGGQDGLKLDRDELALIWGLLLGTVNPKNTKEENRTEMMIAERMMYLFNCTEHKAEAHKDKIVITFEQGEEIQIGTFGWRFIDEGNETLSEVIDDGFPGRRAEGSTNFLVTPDDLKTLATAYFMDRLAYEYESWAERADFAPSTQEFADYSFAGERLNAIQQILSPAQMMSAKKLAGAAFCLNNSIDNNLWISFLGVGTPAVPESLKKTPSHATIMKNLNESERLRHLPKTEEERKRDIERL